MFRKLVARKGERWVFESSARVESVRNIKSKLRGNC
jgi:hypothetical protein